MRAAEAPGCRQVGDASGIQSPLSFGGFGALTRHLHRLQAAISEALEVCTGWPESMSEVMAAVAVSRVLQYHVHGDAASGGFDMLRVSKLAQRWMVDLLGAAGACMLRIRQPLLLEAGLASVCLE